MPQPIFASAVNRVRTAGLFLFFSLLVVLIPGPVRAQEGRAYFQKILAGATQVRLEDYITREEQDLSKVLGKNSRLRGVAEKIASVQVFDASRALGLSAVRVGPTQIPELWQRFTEVARLLGADVSGTELYLTPLGTFASFSWGYADGGNILALSTRAVKNMDADELRFVLAAEVAAVHAGHNLYSNINRLIMALQDASYRQVNGIQERAVKDLFSWDLNTPFFAQLFHVPRVVAAMLGVGALSSYAIRSVVGLLIKTLNKRLFKALAHWNLETRRSANRAAFLVTYLHQRQRGLEHEEAMRTALRISAKTYSKFMLGDRDLADRVDLDELVRQGREMLDRRRREMEETQEEDRGLWGVKNRFFRWARTQFKTWLWQRAGFDGPLPEPRLRTYLGELVELMDYGSSEAFTLTVDRIENPGPALAAATAIQALERLHVDSVPHPDRAIDEVLGEMDERLTPEEWVVLEARVDLGTRR